MKYKFKKGCEVEVWNKREVPSGSWCRAQILSGNGHTYSVKYFPYTSNDLSVERVPRKAIKPLPPVNGLSNWVPGDTVEVFDAYSWRAAELVRAVGHGYYLVRLLGSSMVFRAHKSALRLQLSWQYDKWVMIRKNRVADMENNLPKERNFNHQVLQQRMKVEKHSADYFAFGKDNDSEEQYQSFSKGRKRRPYKESCPEVERKMRAVGEERRHQRLVAGRIPELLEKVDVVASHRTKVGGKYMRASLNNRRTQIIEEVPPVLESSDMESISSSVGSCSPHNSPYRFVNPVGLTEELGSDANPDDTLTSPMSRSESPPPIKEAVAAETHKLELHAYQTTLAALHASGPISWEQEALISDLRRELSISTDEHLLEIRRLIAMGSRST